MFACVFEFTIDHLILNVGYQIEKNKEPSFIISWTKLVILNEQSNDPISVFQTLFRQLSVYYSDVENKSICMLVSRIIIQLHNSPETKSGLWDFTCNDNTSEDDFYRLSSILGVLRIVYVTLECHRIREKYFIFISFGIRIPCS